MPESDSGRGGLGISERRAEVIYQEDIYVGYRYFNTFEKDVSYEFGYGMSYTTFKYSNITINSDKFRNQIKVSVDVKNTGNIPGREVVQVYLTAPKGKLDKPKEELVAFGKTKLLEPNKKETLSFVLKPRDLASFDTDSSSWIAEQGKYIVKVGASSRDIKDSLTFELDEKIIVEKDNKALSPEKETTMPEENLNSIY